MNFFYIIKILFINYILSFHYFNFINKNNKFKKKLVIYNNQIYLKILKLKNF